MVFGGVGWGFGGVVVPMGGEDTGVTSAAEKGAAKYSAEHGFGFGFFCIFFRCGGCCMIVFLLGVFVGWD